MLDIEGVIGHLKIVGSPSSVLLLIFCIGF